MNHVKLTLRIIIERFIKKYFTFCLLLIIAIIFADKDHPKAIQDLLG